MQGDDSNRKPEAVGPAATAMLAAGWGVAELSAYEARRARFFSGFFDFDFEARGADSATYRRGEVSV